MEALVKHLSALYRAKERAVVKALVRGHRHLGESVQAIGARLIAYAGANDSLGRAMARLMDLRRPRVENNIIS